MCLFKISKMFQFSKDFRGAQCQFPATACNPTKLGFNGGYNCSGSGRWIYLNPKISGDGFYDFFCLQMDQQMDCFTWSVKRQVLSQASKTIIVLIPALSSRATSSALHKPLYIQYINILDILNQIYIDLLNTDCDNPSSTFSCHLKCPAPASFSYSPAPIYTCKYSEGVFRPAQVLRMGILKWAMDNHCPTMVMVMVILIGTMRKSNCCKKKEEEEDCSTYTPKGLTQTKRVVLM